MDAAKTSSFKKLNNLFHDPKSDLFLVHNTAKLYAIAKRDASLSDLTVDDIRVFKQHVETISRTNAEKRLRSGLARYSYRPYKFFNNKIISGDLAFIPRIHTVSTNTTNSKRDPGILCVFMECHSRKVSLNFQPNAKAETTLRTFEKALKEDFNGGGQFSHYLSDRGSEFKGTELPRNKRTQFKSFSPDIRFFL